MLLHSGKQTPVHNECSFLRCNGKSGHKWSRWITADQSFLSLLYPFGASPEELLPSPKSWQQKIAKWIKMAPHGIIWGQAVTSKQDSPTRSLDKTTQSEMGEKSFIFIDIHPFSVPVLDACPYPCHYQPLSAIYIHVAMWPNFAQHG